MLRKPQAGIGIATVAALGLAACSPAETNGGGEAALDDLGLPDLSGHELEVATPWTGDEQEAFLDMLAAFADATGAEVRHASIGDDLATVLQTRIDGADPPEVAVIPQPGLVEQFARDGALVELPGEARERVAEHYIDLWRDLGTVDGTEYGVYVRASNKSTFWYNTELFDEVGVSPPDTMDELLETARVLADSGIAPLSVGGSDGWVLTDWFENLYLRIAGPEMYDRLGEREVPWTHPTVEETLELLAELFDENFLAGGVSGALQTDFSTSIVNVFGPDPEAATIYEGDFVREVIDVSTDAVLGEQARFFPFPTVEGAEESVVVGGDVAVAFVDDEATRELMAYLATAEAGEIIAAGGVSVSPNHDVPLDTYPDELSRDIAEQLRDVGENVRFDLSDTAPAAFGATPGSGMWAELQDFLSDTGDIEGTMERLESSAARAYGE
ncbi:ABC transporter substrate-binding protein [Haloechinothrix sp. LS1_15]|uniref:ABC transporter substrate-binding protein n=1 Tax=Haloechinothrix sp. LS1_15 TaxID=2652248 RepID=UPI0029459FA2|nr:ABC transporter substrate-binding protein [Haloechinothrix sp. LS1_15]MDV6013011.1 carbohydrate ABC transporter substrate-binding protein [Haloechinothrix sp. LS1_15]